MPLTHNDYSAQLIQLRRLVNEVEMSKNIQDRKFKKLADNLHAAGCVCFNLSTFFNTREKNLKK